MSDILKEVDIQLPDCSGSKLTREKATSLLKEAGCKPILVKKQREAKKWQAPNGTVKVEWACIFEPQPLVSIGLENWCEDEPAEVSDEKAKVDLSAAIDFLELHREPLKIMNYVEAVEMWAGGGRI